MKLVSGIFLKEGHGFSLNSRFFGVFLVEAFRDPFFDFPFDFVVSFVSSSFLQ